MKKRKRVRLRAGCKGEKKEETTYGVVRGADTAAVLATVELGKSSDTDVLAKVDVASDGWITGIWGN